MGDIENRWEQKVPQHRHKGRQLERNERSTLSMGKFFEAHTESFSAKSVDENSDGVSAEYSSQRMGSQRIPDGVPFFGRDLRTVPRVDCLC